MINILSTLYTEHGHDRRDNVGMFYQYLLDILVYIYLGERGEAVIYVFVLKCRFSSQYPDFPVQEGQIHHRGSGLVAILGALYWEIFVGA